MTAPDTEATRGIATRQAAQQPHELAPGAAMSDLAPATAMSDLAPATGAPFVTGLRSRPETVVLGDAGAADAITVRVQMPEVWDTIRVDTPASEPVLALKVRALDVLYPDSDYHDDFVLKLGGFEVLDENLSVAGTGAVDGSIFLLTHRRRRPVR